MLSLDNATRFLRLDYPVPAYSLISANVTDRYSGRICTSSGSRQTVLSQDASGYSVFVDARTGDPYTPGQDSAKITADRSKTIIKEFLAFIRIRSGEVR